MLYRDVHFEQISKVIGISMDQLRSLNPQYRRDVVTGYNEPTDLRLPVEYVDDFIANEDSIFNYDVDQLMKRAEVAVNDDAPVYREARHERAYSRHSGRHDRRSRHSKKRGGKSVSIREGDTLSDIAERNHTTVAKLKKLNKISGSNIRAGKKIKVK